MAIGLSIERVTIDELHATKPRPLPLDADEQAALVRRMAKQKKPDALERFIEGLSRADHESRLERGQAGVEFALIISLIVLVAVVALQTTGTNISELLNHIAGDV